MSNLKDDLAQFTGTENWYRHGLMRNVLYTDGVQYLAEKAGAYWLLDKVATLQLEARIRAEEFQSWKLTKLPGDRATLVCTDGGNGGPDATLHSEEIEFTDFPLDEITLWVEGNVILLPSEH